VPLWSLTVTTSGSLKTGCQVVATVRVTPTMGLPSASRPSVRRFCSKLTQGCAKRRKRRLVAAFAVLPLGQPRDNLANSFPIAHQAIGAKVDHPVGVCAGRRVEPVQVVVGKRLIFIVDRQVIDCGEVVIHVRRKRGRIYFSILINPGEKGVGFIFRSK